jgi:hypothetical protein
MTAITTVPARMRLARHTPYLVVVAAVAAVVACLLLGTHVALASEKSASHPARGQHEATAVQRAHETRRAQEPRTEENAPPVRHQSARTDPPAAADVSHRHGHAAPPPKRASVTTAPRQAAEPPKEPDQAPVKTLRMTISPGQEDRPPEPRVQTITAAQLPAALPAIAPERRSETVTKGSRPTHGVLFARPKSHDENVSEQFDSDDAAPQPRRESDAGGQPQPARIDQSERQTQPEVAPQVLPQTACRPAVEEHRGPTTARPQVHRASPSGKVVGLVRRPARVFARQQGLALVATPSEALAPILSMGPLSIALPASPSLLPADPSMPFQPSSGGASGPAPVRAQQPAVDATPLASRIQSAVTVGALALLVPLLAIVLLFQIRLMQLMRSLKAEPDQPTTRYYSLTHEEVRELAPDMLPALAHHRFCESERHQGRWRRASWLELEDTDQETPLMWSTCDTCHHQRMTRLRSGREVAALSPQ